MTRNRVLAGIAGLVALPLVAVAPSMAAMPAPKTLADPATTCSQLTARFQKYLGAGMEAQLAKFVSPSFIIVRNDGTSDSWPTYLTNHPLFTAWNISIKTAKFASPVISCAASTSTTQLVNGQPVTSVPTDNLSTYAWQGGMWRITSYGRFNATQ